MAKYRITEIDEEKGHITFEVLTRNPGYDDSKEDTTDANNDDSNDKFVVSDTQTRGDIPFDNIDNIKAALSDYAISIEKEVKAARKVSKKLNKKIGKLLDAKTPEERAVEEKEEDPEVEA